MNKQEKLWQSGFGTAYHMRNQWEDRKDFWFEILGNKILTNATSVLEPGAGKGENLIAIREARKDYLEIQMNDEMLTGIEINEKACEVLGGQGVDYYSGAFLDVRLQRQYNLVITRGFLMHVPTTALQATLTKIYNASSKYICLVEYYSPTRREVEYHGQGSALWIDDFAGRMMDIYRNLKLVRYGFKYHKDNNGNDLTYFILEK